MSARIAVLLASLPLLWVESASAQDAQQLQSRAFQGELPDVLQELEQRPNLEDSELRLLAYLHYCQGNYETSMGRWTEVLAGAPQDIDALQQRANAAWAEGRYSVALADYRRLHGTLGEEAGLSVVLEDLSAQKSEFQDLASSLGGLRWLFRGAFVVVIAGAAFLFVWSGRASS